MKGSPGSQVGEAAKTAASQYEPGAIAKGNSAEFHSRGGFASELPGGHGFASVEERQLKGRSDEERWGL
jgi:hypothetical protein